MHYYLCKDLVLIFLPLRGKRPTIEWSKWQEAKQNEDDLKALEWKNTTGIRCGDGN